MQTMPNVDVLFGNVTEAATFAETEAWEEKDVASIAKKLAALPKNGTKPRMVVITQGADPTIVCVGGEVIEYPIIALPKEKPVDTNGAGDAYVGGSCPASCRRKVWRTVVQLTFPPNPDFTYSA